MSTDYAALSMFVARERVFIEQNTHQWLVIHKTASAGTAQDIARFFATDPQMASTHYVVGTDGTVVQCVLEVDGAAGNCCTAPGHAPYLPTDINLNVLTVSIEHCDPAPDNSTPLTAAQQAASFALVKSICQRHAIPMRPGDSQGGIIGHNDIDPVNRARCPNAYPWSDLFSYLQGGSMGLPIGWSDNGVTITAPNGKTVVMGFRQWILNNVWNAGDIPLEEQHAQSPLEAYYTQPDNEGTQQVFQYSVLNSNQSRGVYLMGVGNEFLGLRAALASAEAEVTALQTEVAALQAQIVALTKGGISQAVKDDINALGAAFTTAYTKLVVDTGA